MTVAFLWHLHQPDYRDPTTRVPTMPWVRLHALRGYRDLPADLLDHGMPATVNVVPSLLDQLLHYANGGLDRHLELTRIPADALSASERHEIVSTFVAGNPRMISIRPGYARIAARVAAHERLSTAEIRDLQVWSALAWCGSRALRDEPILASLQDKGRGFDEKDKEGFLDAQARLLADIPVLWRKMAASGVVAVSASPYYHPILPLLVDTSHARRCMPDIVDFPRFSHPEDAAHQLSSARRRVHEVLGVSPIGLWPSEGSVSPEVIALAREAGFRWFATDEGVLHRSDRDPGHAAGPWSVEGISGFFRDRSLSDRLGFDIASRDPGEAADGFAAALAGRKDLVLVALDGENPWEAFPDGGAAFRARLDARLRSSAVRLDDVANGSVGRIRRLHTGSWIGADFRIWFGHADDYTAWDLLARTRAAIAAADGERRDRAMDALLPAEGSDWFWWYGPEFSTPFQGVFDGLFRAHLRAAWAALGEPAPAGLDRPIGGRPADVVPPKEPFDPPDPDAAEISWSGAGRLLVRGGSMARDALRTEIIWGWTPDGAFWLRVPTPTGDAGPSPVVFDGAAIPLDDARLSVRRGRRAVLVQMTDPPPRFDVRVTVDGALLPPDGAWTIAQPRDLHRALWMV